MMKLIYFSVGKNPKQQLKETTSCTLDNYLQTSRISNVGMCGRKSLPTKKHMNIKSSTVRSKSISNGGLGILNSYSKYSLRVQMLRNCIKKRVMKQKGLDNASSWKMFTPKTFKYLYNNLPGMVFWAQQHHCLSHQIPLPSSSLFLHKQLLNDLPDHI